MAEFPECVTDFPEQVLRKNKEETKHNRSKYIMAKKTVSNSKSQSCGAKLVGLPGDPAEGGVEKGASITESAEGTWDGVPKELADQEKEACCPNPHTRTPGKKFHGDRLKLLVEVCEKWSLFGQAWGTMFFKDAHALIDLGLLEYVCTDNGIMRVRPTEEGLSRYKTIVAGVFGDEVA